MSATVECHTLIFGKTGVTATTYPDGSDTHSATGLTATEATNRAGCYTFSNPTNTGLSRVDLIASGQTKPFWSGWVVLATTGTIVCDDERDVANSVSGGGGGADPLAKPVPGSYSAGTAGAALGVVAALAGSTITFVSPLSMDGLSLFLTTGDSYTTANGQSFKFNIIGGSSLIGTTPHLRLTGVSSDLAVAPAVVSGTQQIVFNDVPASSTANLAVGSYPYQIRFMNGSDVATVIQGFAIVRAGI